MFRLIPSTVSLMRMCPTLQKSGQFRDESAKRKDTQTHSSQWSRPEVLSIADIKEITLVSEGRLL